MATLLFERAIGEAECRLARETRRQFWIRLLTLGLVRDRSRIDTACQHLQVCRTELARHEALLAEAQVLDDALMETVELEGVRVSKHTFSDIPVVEGADYGLDWEELRHEVLTRDEFTCQEADGRCAGPFQIHHEIPLSRGGTNDLRNLRTLCYHHHSLKHDHMRGA